MNRWQLEKVIENKDSNPTLYIEHLEAYNDQLRFELSHCLTALRKSIEVLTIVLDEHPLGAREKRWEDKIISALASAEVAVEQAHYAPILDELTSDQHGEE